MYQGDHREHPVHHLDQTRTGDTDSPNKYQGDRPDESKFWGTILCTLNLLHQTHAAILLIDKKSTTIHLSMQAAASID